MDNRLSIGWLAIIYFLLPPLAVFGEGTSAAPFLDIPVGAGPAAMGSAYSALATNAYAPTWNPAGLGTVKDVEVAAQHLSYIQSTHYEYLSGAYPLGAPLECTGIWCGSSAVGGSIQYFGSGDIQGLDTSGNPTGDYSTHYAAYNMSYGKAFGDKLSLGATGKWINAGLAGVSANAFALDLGSYYKAREDIQWAATLMNAGSKLTFLNDGDSLPLAAHFGGAYEPRQDWTLSLEAVFPRAGAAGVHMGAQWEPISSVDLRAGFRSDTLKGLSPLAGFSAGIGIKMWNQEFAYAWVPYGDLGDSQYLSLVMRFGEGPANTRNLIKYKPAKKQPHKKKTYENSTPDAEPESLMELLNDEPIPAGKTH